MYEGNTFGTQHGSGEDATAPSVVDTGEALHAPKQLDDWRNRDTQPKRRQRACKVCSLLRASDKRATTTAFFCDACSESGPIFLCMKPRRQIRGVAMTCWDIWHCEWRNGKLVPADTGRSIRVPPSCRTDCRFPLLRQVHQSNLLRLLLPASTSKRRRMNI
ncbi:hypothetical protein F444_02432 [Phytophthora nicotianae P1976]|uniref:PiggyBac transposable element-derived protein 4 C-terminal zinc-ribbon domain-containing protein n=1 Tax=Phytophthora nicotianae P1976 TaxID=1317066 RepID=A0A081AXG3_PHYNI|nr:hypothetical protein F444_02432 [Phytophthora nicotianae P1976]